MSSVSIQSVDQPDPLPEPLTGFELERPAAGGEWVGASVEVSGRLTAQALPTSVDILHGDRLLRRLRVEPSRSGRKRRGASHGGRWRFLGAVTSIGLPTDLRLDLKVVFESGESAAAATLQVRRSRLSTGYEPVLQPVIVTSLPGMGATRLMSLLAVHPQVVTSRRVPYDSRTAGYWIATLQRLAEPELEAETDPGDRPGPDLLREPRPGAGLFLDRAARLCQRNIDEWYQELARHQVKSGVRYFAEKFGPGERQRALMELYPGAREVFVVRDLRDWTATLMRSPELSHGERTGGLGRRESESPAAFARRVGEPAAALAAAWEARQGSAIRVGFEELAQDPGATLLVVMGELGLDGGGAGLRELVEEATTELRSHPRASATVNRQALGVWRRDLPPDALTVIREELLATQIALGYQRGPVPATRSSGLATAGRSTLGAMPSGVGEG